MLSPDKKNENVAESMIMRLVTLKIAFLVYIILAFYGFIIVNTCSYSKETHNHFLTSKTHVSGFQLPSSVMK